MRHAHGQACSRQTGGGARVGSRGVRGEHLRPGASTSLRPAHPEESARDTTMPTLRSLADAMAAERAYEESPAEDQHKGAIDKQQELKDLAGTTISIYVQ
eukprot:SAG31_NODE_94_length_26208_cov_6.281091_11_plen_100_part_00